ncbi:MAG: hypothetical protein GX062_09240 [Firmicutes bacterium]|nr:hypothetical protein [Bacillota bacterium]
MGLKKGLSWPSVLAILGLTILLSFIGFRVLGGRNEPSPSPQEPRVTARAVTHLVEEVIYSCGHLVSAPKELPEVEGEPDLELLRKLYPGWEISVSDGEGRLRSRREELCPVCQENLYVGLDDDEVVVFYGLPGSGNKIKERTGIFTRGLPEEAVEDLRVGIRVVREEELLQILEGLMN